jgi:hypothetical protein
MKRVLILLLFVLVVGCNNGGPDTGPMTWACEKCDVDLGADVRDLNASAFWGQYCAVCGHQTPWGGSPVRRRANAAPPPTMPDWGPVIPDIGAMEGETN